MSKNVNYYQLSEDNKDVLAITGNVSKETIETLYPDSKEISTCQYYLQTITKNK